MERELIHKKSRAFNEVSIDRNRCIVYKKSSNAQKLKTEYNWYQQVPKDLSGFIPQAIGYFSDLEVAELQLEYCPYSTLSEVFTSRPDLDWKKIVSRLIEVLRYFEKCTRIPNPQIVQDEIDSFYSTKLKQRIATLRLNSKWDRLLAKSELIINGKSYPNIDLNFLVEHQESLGREASLSVVHGDYCLSNILYDLNSGCLKLIDPRGYFENIEKPSIYGDLNYDLAKLLHSIHGYYDFIVSGKYTLIEFDEQFRFQVNVPTQYKFLKSWIVSNLSQSLSSDFTKDLLFLEVSLFVSMIPLHYEDPKRQLAFYLNAVLLYNEIIEDFKLKI